MLISKVCLGIGILSVCPSCPEMLQYPLAVLVETLVFWRGNIKILYGIAEEENISDTLSCGLT